MLQYIILIFLSFGQTQELDGCTRDSLTTTRPAATYSSISSTESPFLLGTRYGWHSTFTDAAPTTIGTVQIVVNRSANTTSTTTVWNAGFDDTADLYTRNDTNDVGTVTSIITDAMLQPLTLTYPSQYLKFSDSAITWEAYLPTADDDGACCAPGPTTMPAPSRPVITPTAANPANTDDPRGWFSTLTSDIYTIRGTDLASIFPNQNLSLDDYEGCAFRECGWLQTTTTWTTTCAASAVSSFASILATSTSVIL